MNDVGLTDLVRYEGQMLLSLGPPSDQGGSGVPVNHASISIGN